LKMVGNPPNFVVTTGKLQAIASKTERGMEMHPPSNVTGNT